MYCYFAGGHWVSVCSKPENELVQRSYNIGAMNQTVSQGALMILREMADDGVGLIGRRDSRGVFGVVPGPGPHTRRRVSGRMSSDLPSAEFCIELIDAGFCEPTPAVSLNGVPINANVCYRISESGYDLAKRKEPSK